MSLPPAARTIELHLHLEGALALQDAVRLARKYGVDDAVLPSLYAHRDFKEFLAHFGALVSLLRQPEDLIHLLGKTLGKLRRQGVAYAEIRVSPSVWERHGLEPRGAMEALARARFSEGPEYRLIVDGVRQWDRSLLWRDLDLALAHRRRGVVALGLGGDEAAAPAEGFRDMAEACQRARIGFIPHAGEVLGSEEVLSAARLPGVRRIGHGVSVVRCDQAANELRKRGTHLEVCPTSNLVTGACSSSPHPVGELFRKGIPLSLSTDDPALFGTTLAKEERTAREAGLTPKDLHTCRTNAAKASFLPRASREGLIRILGG